MSIKREFKQRPRQIDISKEPYDKYLENLKYWKIKDYETIIKTLQYFVTYKYQCLAEMEHISEKVSVFHKDICKMNDKSNKDQDKVQVCTDYFDKVIELKTKFKKLAKQGCFSGQKKIRSRFEEVQKLKKNLVNVNLIIPNDFILSEKDQYHKGQLSMLYRSFVVYYPEAHNDQTLNQRVIEFLRQLYTEMKKKYFYLKQKEYFSLEMERMCEKLRNQKFLQIKKLMLSGEISIKEVTTNRISVFQNYSAKRKEEEDMMKILRESETLKQVEPHENEQNEEGQHFVKEPVQDKENPEGELNEQQVCQ